MQGVIGLIYHKVFKKDPSFKPLVSVGVGSPHSVSGKSAVNNLLSICSEPRCFRGILMPSDLA